VAAGWTPRPLGRPGALGAPVGFAFDPAEGDTPPLRLDEGWLVLHHGVAGRLEPGRVEHQPAVRYTAGAMLLDPDDVTRVLARSAEPLLEPELPDERQGVVPPFR
jgi:beta-1,2-mannobiose phosphorylase / 1,2-beta-oligomannan phosphorylase